MTELDIFDKDKQLLSIISLLPPQEFITTDIKQTERNIAILL